MTPRQSRAALHARIVPLLTAAGGSMPCGDAYRQLLSEGYGRKAIGGASCKVVRVEGRTRGAVWHLATADAERLRKSRAASNAALQRANEARRRQAAERRGLGAATRRAAPRPASAPVAPRPRVCSCGVPIGVRAAGEPPLCLRCGGRREQEAA